MKSLKLLIIFASLLLLCKAADTKVYKCAKDLKADLCYAKETNDDVTTYYVKGCSKGKKCNIDKGVCIKYKNKLLKEGKKCIIDSECQTGLCRNGKCSYLSDGDDCSNYYDYPDFDACGPKSYCKSGICAKLEIEGNACQGNSKRCVLDTICGTTGEDASNWENYKCIKMFSIEDGVTVSDKLMCKSGLTDDDEKCIKRETKTEEWDEYVKEYNKRLDKINDDEKRKITDIENRETLDNRNVAKKYVEADQYFYEILEKAEDRDCIKDYCVTQLNGNRVNVSLISLFFFSIFFLQLI